MHNRLLSVKCNVHTLLYIRTNMYVLYIHSEEQGIIVCNVHTLVYSTVEIQYTQIRMFFYCKLNNNKFFHLPNFRTFHKVSDLFSPSPSSPSSSSSFLN